jgi:hypothetical protein
MVASVAKTTEGGKWQLGEKKRGGELGHGNISDPTRSVEVIRALVDSFSSSDSISGFSRRSDEDDNCLDGSKFSGEHSQHPMKFRMILRLTGGAKDG